MTKEGTVPNADLTAGDVLILTNCIEQAQHGLAQGADAIDTIVELLKMRGIELNIKLLCPRGCKEEGEK